MCQQPLNGGFYYKSKIPKTERPLSKIKQTKIFERRAERQILWSVRYSYLHSLRSATFNLWHFLTLLLVFSRLSLLLLVPVSAFGVLSTCSKVTAMITPVRSPRVWSMWYPIRWKYNLEKICCVYRIREKQKESNRVQMIETAALSIYTINPAFFASFQFTYNASTL